MPEQSLPKWTVSDLCTQLWDIEKSLDLHNQKINSVYFWSLIRLPLYYCLSKKLGVFSEPSPSNNTRPLSKLSDWAWNIRNALSGIRFLFKNNASIMFLESKRKTLDNDVLIDPYTKDLKNFFSPEEYLVLDQSMSHIYAPATHTKYLRYDLFKLFMRLHNRFFPIKLTQNEEKIITDIEKILHEKFGIFIDVQEFLAPKLYQFKGLRAGFKYFFSRNPHITKVVLTASYGHQALISAAKDAQIDVIEIQHGTITPYHLGYSYPQKNHVPYAPDKLLCYGKKWYEWINLPANCIGQVIGSASIEKYKKLSTSKTPQIVFISQPVLSERLLQIALKVSTLTPNINFIFRLHPKEDLDCLKTIASKDYNELPTNFSFSSGKPHIYELLAKSEYQAGVFSTALIEGMSLGCKTILFNLPGIEYMSPFIDEKEVLLIEDVEQFASQYKNAPSSNNCSDFFTSPVQDISDLFSSSSK